MGVAGGELREPGAPPGFANRIWRSTIRASWKPASEIARYISASAAEAAVVADALELGLGGQEPLRQCRRVSA